MDEDPQKEALSLPWQRVLDVVKRLEARLGVEDTEEDEPPRREA